MNKYIVYLDDAREAEVFGEKWELDEDGTFLLFKANGAPDQGETARFHASNVKGIVLNAAGIGTTHVLLK